MNSQSLRSDCWKCRSTAPYLSTLTSPVAYFGRKRFRVSTAPRFAEALRRLQAARLAEVEALGELVSALAGATPGASVGLNDSPAASEPRYLSVRQLAARIPYAEQTIRNLMHSGELVEGEHYFKRRGRVIFSWPAMRSWVERQDSSANQHPPLPLARNRKNGRPKEVV